jgi:hypothetical protein
MKGKTWFLLAVLLLLGTALVSAQHRGPGWRSFRQEKLEKLSISGELQLINGHIALESGGVTYYILGLDRLTGFVKDLQEGAEVSLEGGALPQAPEYRYFWAEKLTFNGKVYDNLRPTPPERPFPRNSPRGFRHNGRAF